MSKSSAPDDAELDENGLIVQTTATSVLVVIPSEGFDETTLRYARSALHNVHVGTRMLSTQEDELVHGTMQDELQPDGVLAGADVTDYAGVLFCGGPGAIELASNPDAQRLARDAMAQGKLVGAWGESVLILARAGVLQKRKATGAASIADELRQAGAKYRGHQLVIDGKLVTALDDAAGLRFGKALVQLVSIG
ncbi:MAG: protease I [Planctomycetota bacterium]|jgi:protease I